MLLCFLSSVTSVMITALPNLQIVCLHPFHDLVVHDYYSCSSTFCSNSTKVKQYHFSLIPLVGQLWSCFLVSISSFPSLPAGKQGNVTILSKLFLIMLPTGLICFYLSFFQGAVVNRLFPFICFCLCGASYDAKNKRLVNIQQAFSTFLLVLCVSCTFFLRYLPTYLSVFHLISEDTEIIKHQSINDYFSLLHLHFLFKISWIMNFISVPKTL